MYYSKFEQEPSAKSVDRVVAYENLKEKARW